MDILIGLVAMVVVCGLVALAFQPLDVPHRFRDANSDGEPD